MNKKFVVAIVGLVFAFTCLSAPIEYSKVFVPVFSTQIEILEKDFQMEEAYLEIRSEFIKCTIACSYRSKMKTKAIYAKQLSHSVVKIENTKALSKRFFMTGARLSECGVNIVIKGKIRNKRYLSRRNLYKRYSDASKKDCKNKDTIEKLVEEGLVTRLVFDRFLGPIK